MKHLNTFSIFESDKIDIEDYIKDIALPLSDIGLRVIYRTSEGDTTGDFDDGDKNGIVLYIIGTSTINTKIISKQFYMSKIIDDVNHIISFLDYSGYTLFSNKYRETWSGIFKISNVPKTELIEGLELKFKK